MNYYEERERKNVELVECWWFITKWVLIVLFLMWLGFKLL